MTSARQEIRQVVRAQAGDAAALDALLQAVQEPLYHYVLAWFDARPSILLAVVTLLIYSTVFASVMGLRFHLDSCTRRILQGLESLAPEAERGSAKEQDGNVGLH